MGRNSTNNDNSAVGAEFASVVSPNGFSTGDLVYRYSSGYGSIPNGSVSFATFPVTANFQNLTPPVLTTGSLNILDNQSGGFNDECADVLTNGNIVIGFNKLNATAQSAFFRIVDANNNVIVADTAVTTASANRTAFSTSPVSVVALTGGGFAVVWISDTAASAFRLCLRIYDNTGTAVTAVITVATALTPSYMYLRVASRPDGRFVAVVLDNAANQPYAAVFNANGTNYSSFTQVVAQQTNQMPGLAVFSDNTFLVVSGNNINSTVNWSLFSALGAVTNTGSVTAVANGSVAMTKLSTDVVAVFMNPSGFYFSTFTKSTLTFTTPIILSGQPTNQAGGTNALSVFNIPGTDNVIVTHSSNSDSFGYTTLLYSVLNGTNGSVISGSNYYILSGLSAYSFSQNVKFLNVGGYYRGFTRAGTNNTNSSNFNGITCFFDLDPVTYLPRSYNGVSGSAGTSSALPVNVYSKANSLPATAKFLATTSAEINATVTQGAVLLPQTVVESVTTYGLRVLRLSTGNFAVVYKTASQVKVALYNSAGVKQTTFIIGITDLTIAQGLSCCELQNGNIVIAWNDGVATSVIKWVILSSSFVSLYSGTVSNVYRNASSGAANGGVSISALYNSSRWVMIYGNSSDSNFATATVFTSTGTILTGPTRIVTTVFGDGAVCALPNGGFVALVINSVSTNYSLYFYRLDSAGSTYTQLVNLSVGSGNYSLGTTLAISPVGIVSGHFGSQLFSSYVNSSSVNTYGSASIISSTLGATVAVTSLGTGLTCSWNAATTFMSMATPSFQNTSATTFSVGTVIPSVFATNTYMCPAMAPLYGPYMIMAVNNTSQYPTVAIIAPSSTTYYSGVIAGTTASSDVSLDPSTGFSLIGVAASDCAAGGAGQVQTKGTAVLSSSYPTTTQTFDFTNPVTYGVKGTVSNRVITLED